MITTVHPAIRVDDWYCLEVISVMDGLGRESREQRAVPYQVHKIVDTVDFQADIKFYV